MLLSELLRKAIKVALHFVAVAFEKTATSVVGFILWFCIEVYMWWNEYTTEQRDSFWDRLAEFTEKFERLVDE